MERCVIMPAYQRLVATLKKTTGKKDEEVASKV
jgi:hypothetical protein